MVLRSFSNFTKCKNTGFSFSRKASTSSYTHQFFNPSYISPKDLITEEEIASKSGSKNDTNYNTFTHIAPALSVTKNYIVCDSSNNTNNNGIKRELENEMQIENQDFLNKILLRKSCFKGNKNGHLNINIQSVTNSHTTLNIRRSNSNSIKTVTLNNNSPRVTQQQRREFSTKNLEEDIANLKLEEESKEVKESREADQNKQTKQISHVKFQQKDFNKSVDEALDTFLYDDPVITQEQIIDNLMSLDKNNEILPIYLRMKANEIIPSIETYNKVLKSIQLRDTDESSEEKLTHLLNTYSDMLSNNLKPTERTYELVIEPLLKGSIESFKSSNFKNGNDFFKIAMELFLISHNNDSIKFKNNNIYINLLDCLNYYRGVNSIEPIKLYEILKSRINQSNLIEFYLQLIKFSTLSQNANLVEHFYNLLKNSNEIPVDQLKLKQKNIYTTLIESLNFCGEINKSSKILDEIINSSISKESENSKKLISSYISSFMSSQALIAPLDAFKTLHKFNSIKWLPDVSIGSLIVLSQSFIKAGDIQMAMKVWNFTVIREDFDYNFKNLNVFEVEKFSYISNFFNDFTELILLSQDKNLIIKTAREILIKNSLVLNDNVLLSLLSYLQQNSFTNLASRIIVDQGYKKQGSNNSLNNYLSLIVDFLLPNQYLEMIETKFFRSVVEQYRLIKDNVYGLIKIFKFFESNLQNFDTNENRNLKLKMNYYAKVLRFEFNDIDNCYVELPQELTNFKNSLQTWC